jgi:hypothetical protein
MQTLDASIRYICIHHSHAIGIDEKIRVVDQGRAIYPDLRIETTHVDKGWLWHKQSQCQAGDLDG